jgi:hypothetical protein
MLVRDSTWNAIRALFSEEEKAELRTYITGEAICPMGFVVDSDKIPVTLRDKLINAIQTVRNSDPKR